MATGRRSFLYAGSEAGARRAAVFYSCIETCRLHGVDPVAWLTDVIPKISRTKKSDLADLLPRNWKLAHQNSAAA